MNDWPNWCSSMAWKRSRHVPLGLPNIWLQKLKILNMTLKTDSNVKCGEISVSAFYWMPLLPIRLLFTVISFSVILEFWKNQQCVCIKITLCVNVVKGITRLSLIIPGYWLHLLVESSLQQQLEKNVMMYVKECVEIMLPFLAYLAIAWKQRRVL